MISFLLMLYRRGLNLSVYIGIPVPRMLIMLSLTSSFMETNKSRLDHLVLLILESLPNILGKGVQPLNSIFASHEVSSILKYTGDIEMSVDTKSGLISIIQTDGISKRCAIYPNSLHSTYLLIERCNELFLKISDSKWINQEGDILIKKHKVYGLLSFFSLELV